MFIAVLETIALVIIASLALVWVRSQPRTIVPTGPESVPAGPPAPPPNVPVSFGYKCAWLAIASAEPLEVMKAVPIQDAERSGWPEGIEAAYNSSVFVSPPVEGWVLVVSSTLLMRLGNGEEMVHFAGRLSEALNTTVQYFATHRVDEFYAWALATSGKVARAYVYCGGGQGTILDLGPPTQAEQALGFRFFDQRAPEAADDTYWERTDLSFPDEDSVMALAGKWSINPLSLENKPDAVGLGWLGTLK